MPPGTRTLLTTCCFALALAGGARAETVARITGVLIRGAEQTPPANGAVFKGIPFAQAPVGSLAGARNRSRSRTWKATRERDALRPSPARRTRSGRASFPSSLAKLYGHDFPPQKIDMSEDCLYLNVWTPEWLAKDAVPVMFWYPRRIEYHGQRRRKLATTAALATKGIVVVTINYRLGIFGSFAHPQLTQESPHHASGNYGLLDQIAALQWVQQNIAQFGGDPARVTVFGESAGAIDAGLLLCSPLASGLMQRVIMESGPVLLSHHPPALAKGEQFGEQMALSLGANADHAIEKMRALPAETVIEKSNEQAKPPQIPG